ncbi:MAG: methionine--tRNA ligase [Candidatus Pacebacteria bacterium CG10_big_fil_rev_8_21_14_0_10_56_10]|nr:MAG: methionine--tRNA ligase [Candidatus Pacebacteria bacterium CG10_big_fil_rev_8_21_14_0_10_56_10]
MTDVKPTIEYDDFAKLDIRIGRVVAASLPDWSRKLIELSVEFDSDTRSILAGISQWYGPDDLISNYYLFVVNLAEKKMGPAVSQGMMLMADAAERPVPLKITDPVAVGVAVR